MYISVIIITFNEERNILRCIKSVSEVADEILVIDSFSTDKTVEICKSLNTKVLQREFKGYGDQKRYATEQAKYDVILSLDADEELSETLIESIKKIKINTAFDCFSFDRNNLYCNKSIKFCGWAPDKQIRLYNRQLVNWNTKEVHESIEVSKDHRIMHLEGVLNHYTCQTIAEHQKKEKKYAEINGQILAKKGRKIIYFTPHLKGGFRFIKTYVLKLGLLDGHYGFVISKTLAKSSYTKYKTARNSHNKFKSLQKKQK